MAKNTFSILGIFALLLVSLSFANAATTSNGVTIYFNQTTITNATNGEVYPINIVIENLNSSNYNVTLSNGNWGFSPISSIINNGNNGSFIGTYTITSAGTSTVTARIYDVSDSLINFTIDRPLTISHYTAPVSGCTNSSANNYNASATVDDGSCTYTSSTDTICEILYSGENGEMEISDFDVTNDGEGKDEEWTYLDAITVEVEIENTDNDDSISDVEVQIIIKNSDGEDVTDDFDFDEDVIDSIGRLNDDDQELVVFTIKELPSDIETGNYKLYIVAYSDGDEENNCVSEFNDFTDDLYFEFEIIEVDYEDSIIARNLEDLDAVCGVDNFEITVPIYNLFVEDEESVLVNIYNNELGIDEYTVISDLRDGRNENANFFVSIPDFLDKAEYRLEVIVYFDWDDNEDEMEETSYEEKTSSSFDITVLGCALPGPSMKPSLDSATQEGNELVVKTIVTNNAKDGEFQFAVSGYESWANLVSITPESSTIKKGEFAEVTVVLIPTESGMQSFKISSVVDGETFNQPVSVNIKGSSLFEVENPYLIAGIALVAVMFVSAAVVLTVNVSRRRPAKSKF
jgi:hypothetical protein